MLSTLKNSAAALPHSSGVYLFKNASGRVIYVGKAIDLKKRVASYFRKNPDDPKVRYLQSQAAELDFILCASETEALLLENTLIKKYRPRYNIILRDDKQYPYLKLTLNETWPRLLLVRRIEKDGAEYFGPFSSRAARQSLRLIKKLYPIRWCKGTELSKRERPCLFFHLKQCLAPCQGKVRRAEYLNICRQVSALLKGKMREASRRAREEMEKFSRQENFERAAAWRDTMLALTKMAEEQKVITAVLRSADVFVCSPIGSAPQALVLKIRQGKLMDKQIFRLRAEPGVNWQSALPELLMQYYSAEADPPRQVIVENDFPERETCSRALASGRPTLKITPARNQKDRALVNMARENLRFSISTDDLPVDQPVLQNLQAVLKMEKLPVRVEAFDISNLQGSAIVAALVVFENGRPNRSQYRKFNIRSVTGPDDLSAMREVVCRRFTGALSKQLRTPDLVLIDGGLQQLRAARQAMVGSARLPLMLISLAKKQEEIFTEGSATPLRLDSSSPALQFLQRVRDEAHRFAVTFHRQQRLKKMRSEFNR